MGIYQFKRTQEINRPIERVWEFISNPQNLSLITPSYLGIKISTLDNPPEIYKGMIISYKINIFSGIRSSWVSEITHVQSNHYFVDEQKLGPYKFWHHQHFLESNINGTLMTDIVSYKLPFGLLGKIVHKLIRDKIENIFDYRTKTLDNLFD